jgi:hypothetical protein
MTRKSALKTFSGQGPSDDLLPYEKILAQGLREFVAELCLTDAGVLVSYVCNNLHANIEDLIDSSAELYLKEGALRYSHAAWLDFEWGRSPAIVFDMEFISPPANVFFKLALHGFYVGVAIQRILVGDQSDQETFDPEAFAEAVNRSRLLPSSAPIAS